jgi:hypothetical protein
MFEEPDEPSAERPFDPAVRAKEKYDEFRMHAELAAVFEGCRKFEAQILPALDPEIAREVQKSVARLEKAKSPDSPILPDPVAPDAARLLALHSARNLSTNDYHIYRRPGEAMILRWLAGDEIETFYGRMQAHFDAALNQFREEERQSHGWKQDPKTLAYLAALDVIEIKLADLYLREVIRKLNAFVLSTQSADDMDIVHLCDYLMGLDPAAVVGPASAPPEAPTEQDRAWFFKLFSLRGIVQGTEQMCFFTYMQKTDDSFDEL